MGTINAGDTAFMIICAALVFFMTPGLAFFYGGLVRRKNVVNTMMACVAIMGLSVVMWALFGYSLSFGGNYGGVIGDFRWFGFNAGSALKADGLAAHAFMTSAISAASALLSWMLLDYITEKKATLVGASTGLVIGLVAITPGAGFVPIWSAFIIGALVSPICFFGVKLIKKILKIDDALDAFGCHGIGGIWGGLATGIFGQSSINSVAKWDGLVFGEYRLFVAQLIGIIVSIAIAIVGTLICVAIVRIFTPLRVDVREEQIGLDISQHGETAYPSFNGMDQ